MLIKLCSENLATVQPITQSLFTLLHCQFQAANRSVRDLCGSHQFRNCRAQRLLIGLEQTELLVEPDAIQDRE